MLGRSVIFSSSMMNKKSSLKISQVPMFPYINALLSIGPENRMTGDRLSIHSLIIMKSQ